MRGTVVKRLRWIAKVATKDKPPGVRKRFMRYLKKMYKFINQNQ